MTVHLFLISSPLQAIVVENIKNQYLFSPHDQYYIFSEGGRLVDLFDKAKWTKIIVGENTRPSTEDPKKNIKYNLKLLSSHLDEKNDDIILYISELFWLFNNVVFSHLKKQFGKKMQCFLFDEGLVMYRNYELSISEKLKSLLKYSWLKMSGFPATLIKKHFILNDDKINGVYCYHPQLISQNLSADIQKKLLLLDPSLLTPSFEINKLNKLDSRSVLILSQPYYRVMPEADYEALFSAMIDYFRAQGYEHFYVKPHDADDPLWLDKLTERYKVKVFREMQSVPIESLAPHLKCGVIVAICSSALLNLKLFGFKGEIISFGMNRCDVSNKIKRSHYNARVNYKKIGVKVINQDCA